ncbi:MAG: tetratricopeptide repeat protein [Pseudomonadota bacterium]
MFSRGELEGLDKTGFDEAALLKVDAIELTQLVLKPNSEALANADAIIDRANQAGDLLAEAFATAVLAEAVMVLGRLDDVEMHVDALRGFHKTLSFPRLQRDIIQLESNLLEKRGDTVAALSKSRELFQFYTEHNQPNLAVIALIATGNVLYDLGDYEAALDQYVLGLEQLNNSPKSSSANYAVLLQNAGSALTDLGRHEEAIPYYEQALEINERLGNQWSVSYDKFWMAKSLNALGETDRAYALAAEAAELSEQYAGDMQTANILLWMAERSLERQDTFGAEAALSKAASVLELDPNEDLSKNLGGADRYWAVSYARSMASVMRAMGDPAEALRYAEYALDSHADWLEAEKVKAVVDTETLFEIRSKDQAIALQETQLALADSALARRRLQAVIASLSAAGLAVISALAILAWRNSRRLATMRETLVAEEHHRTKNTLQMASSLARANKSSGISQRLFAMGLVYQHLHAVEGKSELDARPFLSTLVNHITEALAPDGVSADVDCSVSSISADAATPVGLIVCEALMNAYKHAFRQKGGSVHVSFHPGKAGSTLSVSDDGVGDKNANRTTSGNGSTLIRDLAKQLKAEAFLKQDSHGTTWIVAPISIR